jgi:hypothetical protein
VPLHAPSLTQSFFDLGGSLLLVQLAGLLEKLRTDQFGALGAAITVGRALSSTPRSDARQLRPHGDLDIAHSSRHAAYH